MEYTNNVVFSERLNTSVPSSSKMFSTNKKANVAKRVDLKLLLQVIFNFFFGECLLD